MLKIYKPRLVRGCAKNFPSELCDRETYQVDIINWILFTGERFSLSAHGVDQSLNRGSSKALISRNDFKICSLIVLLPSKDLTRLS